MKQATVILDREPLGWLQYYQFHTFFCLRQNVDGATARDNSSQLSTYLNDPWLWYASPYISSILLVPCSAQETSVHIRLSNPCELDLKTHVSNKLDSPRCANSSWTLQVAFDRRK